MRQLVVFGLYALFFGLSIPVGVHAADGSLVISPRLGEYAVGESFTVSLMANTDTTSATAAEAALQFNPALLEIESVSTGFSPLSLWSEEPTYSNESGSVSFSGWASEPFSGSSVELLRITFRAKTTGTNTVTLTSGALLAEDGKSTNILTALGAATYTVRAGVPDEEDDGLVLGISATNESGIPHAPELERVPTDAVAGDKLVVTGRAIRNGRVIIWIHDGTEEKQAGSVIASADGAFVFVSDTRLVAGSYEVWAEAYTVDGALSPASERVQFTVALNGSTVLAAAFFGAAEAPILLFIGLLLLGGILGYGMFLFLTRRSH